MKFECGDLERAFSNPDLLPEARAHIKTCAACRREFNLWNDISSTAQQLHQDWETPDLWPQIRHRLEAEPKAVARPAWKNWRMWAIAAAVLLTASSVSILFKGQHASPLETITSANQDFLTEKALQDVEKTEAAYRQSIDQLARIAEPRLENAASPAAVNAREKLLLLDTAIDDTRSNIASNRFNLRLQTTLADLYRQKQQTLKELLTNDKTN